MLSPWGTDFNTEGVLEYILLYLFWEAGDFSCAKQSHSSESEVYAIVLKLPKAIDFYVPFNQQVSDIKHELQKDFGAHILSLLYCVMPTTVANLTAKIKFVRFLYKL